MLSATIGPNALGLSGAVVDVGKDQNSPTRFGISNQNTGASAVAGIDLEAAGGGWQLDVPPDVATFANPLIGKFNGSEKFRFTSDGNYVPKTAAKGINFTANTPAAGMTSQLLNWYEEGTWTPNQGGGLTVVGAFSSSGKYIRIGSEVRVSGTVTGATSVAVTAAGIITTNLPFTVGTAGHGNVTNAALTSFAAIICTSTNVTSAGAIAATGTLTFSATYFV